jgi:four helix bundle protein
MARGSLLELQTQLEIATELSFIGVAESESLAKLCYAELGLLNRLMDSLAPRQGGSKASG